MTTRQAFETEARKHGFILDRLDKSGVYVQLITEQAWSIWKAATDAALERAEKACEEEAADIRSEGKGCHTGRYDHMADGAGRCAQAIHGIKEKP